MVVASTVETEILSKITNENHRTLLTSLFAQRDNMDIDEFMIKTEALVHNLSDDLEIKSYLINYFKMLTKYTSLFCKWGNFCGVFSDIEN